MKKVIVQTLTLIFLCASTQVSAEVVQTDASSSDPSQIEAYTFDPLQTSVTWSVSHYGFSFVTGKFTHINGQLSLNPNWPPASKIKAVIDLSKHSTGIENLDSKLNTADFFNIRNFSEAVFSSTKIKVVDKDKGKYKLEGTLEFNGFTKPVTLDVTMNKAGIQPQTSQKTVGFTATGTLLRTEFGMPFGLPDIGNEVKIEIQAEAVQRVVDSDSN